MEKVAIICERCDKTVIVDSPSDNSDMVETRGRLLYLCDRTDQCIARPAFNLNIANSSTDVLHYCPDCLVYAIKEWIDTLKKIPPSDIPKGGIIPGRRTLSNE